MAEKITILSSDVWGYFQNKKEDLKSYMHQIAGNPEYGVEIFVTEDCGLPNIVVTADDVQIYEETAVSEHDCKKTVDKIYDEYLTSKAVSAILSCMDKNDDEPTDLEIDDTIAEREEELDSAIYDFLLMAMGNSYYDCPVYELDDIINDCKEHFLEYVARKHDIPVYRPMMLEYEDGKEEMSPYPYEDMEFDDPDNPLYSKDTENNK